MHSTRTPLRRGTREPFQHTCMYTSCRQVSKVNTSRSSFTPIEMAQALPETAIEFLNHRGEKLVGTLMDPEVQQQQALPPVLIMAHGYMSTRNSELLVRLATALGRSCQLSSFRFDFSGNGDSEGDFRYGNYMSEAEELRCAKQHLEQQLGRRVVGMLGHSKGATDVLLYAAKYDDVPCIVNLAARFEVQKGVLERLGSDVLEQLEQLGQVEMQGRSNKGPFKWTLRKTDLESRLSTDMAAACSKIQKTAVLTVHGDADADVPVAEAQLIAQTVQCPHELVVLEGADHCFTNGAAMYELAAAVLPFVARHASGMLADQRG